MTATTRFIEDAIEGGWGDKHDRFLLHEVNQEIEFCTYFKEGELDYHGEETELGQHKSSTRISVGIALLDPKTWQAVGKTRGWSKYIYKNGEMLPNTWYSYWHVFIDHLANGDDIETALSKLV